MVRYGASDRHDMQVEFGKGVSLKLPGAFACATELFSNLLKGIRFLIVQTEPPPKNQSFPIAQAAERIHRHLLQFDSAQYFRGSCSPAATTASTSASSPSPGF